MMAVQAPAGPGGRRLLARLTEAAPPRTMVDDIIANVGTMGEAELEDALGMLVDALGATDDIAILRDSVRAVGVIWKEMRARRTKVKEAATEHLARVPIRETGVILGPLDQPAVPPPPSALRTQLLERLEASILRRLPAHGLAPAARKPCPHDKGETVLCMMETMFWPHYLPGRPLELRWQEGNKLIGGQTRFCEQRRAHLVTLDVSPQVAIRDLVKNGLHEIGHVKLGHLGRGVTWWADPVDRMTLDAAHDWKMREAAGRPPTQLARDLEAEAEAFAVREIGRWLKE